VSGVEPYFHFLAVVTFQIAVIFVAKHFSTSRFEAGTLFKLLVIGIPVGLFFDSAIGDRYEVFSYPEFGESKLFVLTNSLLSYGVALCTAWFFPCRVSVSLSRSGGRTGLMILIAVVLFVSMDKLGDLNVMQRAVLSGIAILLLGETLAMARCVYGPLSLLLLGDWRPFLCLEVCSVIVGVLYEAANFAFPLWRWHLDPDLPYWASEAVIVTFGYFVLFHPMFIVSRLVVEKPQEADSHRKQV